MSNIHENFCFQLTNLFKEFIHRIQNKEGEIISQVITKSLKYKILLNFTHVTMKLSMRVEHKMSVFSVHAAPKKFLAKSRHVQNWILSKAMRLGIFMANL